MQMETSLDHYIQLGLAIGMEGSLDPSDLVEDRPQDTDYMRDAACPDSILNFILDADKIRKTQEDKLNARFRLGLPPDPREWTVDNLNSWLSWFYTTFDLPIADDLGSKLTSSPLDGDRLAQWVIDDFYQFFGPNGDLMHENFSRWLDVLPGSQNIHDDLYEVQRDIFRLEDVKSRLFDTMVGQPADYGSSMGSPPLSPPMSDDFASHDLDASQSRFVPGEGSSTTPSWYPCVPRGFSVCDEDLIIEPEVAGTEPAVRPKRPRGRPRKPKPPKQKRSQPILYKFILGHLNDPGMREILEWVSKASGVFRFHSARKEEFAEMWGRYKGNREQMTYQNMARALRNYTRGRTKIMERVKRKLHYKFCPDFIQ